MFSNPKCDAIRMVWLKNKCNKQRDKYCKELMEEIVKCEEKYY